MSNIMPFCANIFFCQFADNIYCLYITKTRYFIVTQLFCTIVHVSFLLQHYIGGLGGPVYWCPTQFPCQLMSFNSITERVTLVEQELLTLPKHTEFISGFITVCVAQSLVFCVVFCRTLSSSILIWPLHCLCSFNLQLLLSHLVCSKCISKIF